MRHALLSLGLLLVVCACGPSPNPSPRSTPSPAATLQPLPEGIGGIPGPADTSAEIAPHSARGELVVGEARNYPLPHCGLMSPIDIDGSLWAPVGVHNGAGGPLNETQIGELINPTQTIVVLTDTGQMEMSTRSGAIVVLERHDGPRRYFLCD